MSLLYNEYTRRKCIGGMVLLRCRIFSTEEWRACLGSSRAWARLLLHEVKVRVRRGVERTPGNKFLNKSYKNRKLEGESRRKLHTITAKPCRCHCARARAHGDD